MEHQVDRQDGIRDVREALAARPDEDFVISAPVRRKSAVRAKPRKVTVGERVMAFVLSHPREMLAATLLTGCAGIIAWNALVLQSARHPAPLFNQRDGAAASARPVPPTRPVVTQSVAPDPQVSLPPSTQLGPAAPAQAIPPAAAPKLPSRSAIADLIRNGGEVPSAPPRPVAPSAPAPAAGAAPVMRDPIGEIIRMGGPVPTPPANVGKAGDVVLSGQRALAKLGYNVKPDGMMGAGTRQAIERFEQERRLPVTGEFNPRTVRELTTASGMAVQ